MFRVVFIVLLFLFTINCGGRIPSANSAHSLTKGFFKSYAKKYEKSVLGGLSLERVGINAVQEQAHHLAEIDANLSYSNGRAARVLITAKKVPPFGWHVQSWEMLGYQ